jgi:hemolysin activation/secretion protein
MRCLERLAGLVLSGGACAARWGRVAWAVLVCAAAGPPVLAQEAEPRGPAAAVAQVRGYEVLGNTLLPQTLIDERLRAYTGALTLARLREAAAAVQELYRRAGYGGVVAFLPGQEAREGVVRIRVVEGKVARVVVSGPQQFSEQNIRASLPSLREGETPRVREIDAQLQIGNENPAKTVQVLLQPGADPGSIEAQLKVAERPLQRWTLRSDNTGSRDSGRWRAALGWQHASVAGTDQVFSAELQTAPRDPSSVRVFSAAWRAPFYAQALVADAYGAWSDVDGGRTATAAGDLQFAGRGAVLGLRLSAYLPRLGNIDQRLVFGLERRDYRNTCVIDGLPQEACGSAGATVVVQPLSLGYTAQATDELAWGLSLSLHANAPAGGAHGGAAAFEAVRAGSRPGYKLLRGAGNLGLGPFEALGGAGLQAQLSLQASGQRLVPGEQFGAGGATSVRGYEERELNGDSGAQATLELGSAPFTAAALGGAQLRAALFTDAGWVANRGGDRCFGERSSCHIAGLGLGLRLGWGQGAWQAQLRLDVARALVAGPRSERGATRVHAAAQLSL